MAKYVFGNYLLDVDERRLLRDNGEVRLRGKLFDTLRVLVENAGKLVRKDAFMESVWPDSVVEDNNLDYCISQLRKLLHPEKYIETVPRHGYRFVGDVTAPESHVAATPLGRHVEQPDVQQQPVEFFTTSDGVRIAYSVGGKGPVIVRAIHWLNHLDFEWQTPMRRQWLSEVMRHNTLLRYDQRGSGLSDWNVSDFSFERTIRDFEELVDAAHLEQFSILGGCQGAAVAIAYAVRHPERVSKLIINGAFANGWPAPAPGVQEQMDALMTLIRSGWGRDNPAFRQLWTTLFRPDANAAETAWLNELQRISSSPENAARMIAEFPNIKVLDMLPKISCPSLVLHSRDDGAVPLQEGKLIAARIRGARFVELPSRSHMVSPGDAGWEQFVGEVSAFMGW
ncbi:MAG TPA: alpha/beta fold hydrolase [Candidatus Eisenbacteria bacterium]|nr:alpha/beta fold hydrolase [Candidatus Eisenbacteria bacterium]